MYVKPLVQSHFLYTCWGLYSEKYILFMMQKSFVSAIYTIFSFFFLAKFHLNNILPIQNHLHTVCSCKVIVLYVYILANARISSIKDEIGNLYLKVYLCGIL